MEPPKFQRLIAHLNQAGGRCQGDGIGRRRHLVDKAVRGLANKQTPLIFLPYLAVD